MPPGRVTVRNNGGRVTGHCHPALPKSKATSGPDKVDTERPKSPQRSGCYRAGRPQPEVTLFMQRPADAEIQEAAICPQSRPRHCFPVCIIGFRLHFLFKKFFFGKGYCPEFFKWFGFLFFPDFFSLIACSSNNSVIYGLQAASCHRSHTELCFLNRWLLSL